ncbi:tyrosine-type recombinase/integrase [Bacillus safensis]|uniref:tyrosine-type recombinase/integrase n=1 Tax=Bacillus safensis TaxID=561879 RepID=UPI0022819D96|nr:tyrosine-type recombinase/integrase [Bacillus safensis]MCY7542216.1 site-specific integrase [Bacillus safensis]MCY7551796.1 site-specific integrase [Bacillus safensis]MCY7644642.1 site-specific integrase [Bacillus safensis]MCY7654573.1 site-specific integrase [Bacillus safensis]MEC3711254.1 tyrosine-type recombinase/integrase [Bacillus safensis]
MHFKELVKGKKWLAVGDGPPDPVTGKRKQIPRRGKTKKEAEQRVLKAIAALEEDGIDESVVKKMTFEKLAADWIRDYTLTTGNKKGTIRIRTKEIKILNRYIAKTNIAKITTRKYQKILNDLTEQEYARNTISGVHTTAGLIFKYAIQQKLLKHSPTEGAVVPKKRLTVEDIENNPIEEKYFEKEELEEFLLTVKEFGLDMDLERFYLLAFSGMRSGELCALKWTDINFETKEIRITKTIYSENNNMKEYELIPPKTAGSVRTIEVEDQIMDMLKEYQMRQKKRRLQSRIKPEEYHDGNFVFARENGYPFLPKNIIVRMERLLEKTSIKKHATPHIFRHTHISMLTEARVDITTIMKRVGHDDMKTTMRIYTHVTEKMKEDASQKVQKTFGNILNIGIS